MSSSDCDGHASPDMVAGEDELLLLIKCIVAVFWLHIFGPGETPLSDKFVSSRKK